MASNGVRVTKVSPAEVAHAPVLLSFPSCTPTHLASLVFSHASKGRRHHVQCDNHPGVLFEGSGKANDGVKWAVIAVGPNGVARAAEAVHVKMNMRVRNEEAMEIKEEKDDRPGMSERDKNWQSLKTLAEEFGSAARKKILADIESSAIKPENVTGADKVRDKISSLQEDDMLGDEEDISGGTRSLLPPHDAHAGDARDVYPLSKIIEPEGIWAADQVHLRQMEQCVSNPEAVAAILGNIKAAFFIDALLALQAIEDPTSQGGAGGSATKKKRKRNSLAAPAVEEKCKMLCYLVWLLKFRKLKSSNMHDPEWVATMCDCPIEVAAVLIERFTEAMLMEGNRIRRQVTKKSNASTFFYILALALHISDFSLPLDKIAETTSTSMDFISSHYKEMGCKITHPPPKVLPDGTSVKSPLIVSLNPPIEFPKVHMRAKPKKKN